MTTIHNEYSLRCRTITLVLNSMSSTYWKLNLKTRHILYISTLLLESKSRIFEEKGKHNRTRMGMQNCLMSPNLSSTFLKLKIQRKIKKSDLISTSALALLRESKTSMLDEKTGFVQREGTVQTQHKAHGPGWNLYPSLVTDIGENQDKQLGLKTTVSIHAGDFFAFIKDLTLSTNFLRPFLF